jgi:geranylgeranyl transferase type-2 subunit alpha
VEKRELAICEELMELEPDAKWPLVTSVVLMVHLRKQGHAEYEDKITSYLDRLEEVDPYRKMYYRSMRLTC